jgi:hypothetical protein
MTVNDGVKSKLTKEAVSDACSARERSMTQVSEGLQRRG